MNRFFSCFVRYSEASFVQCPRELDAQALDARRKSMDAATFGQEAMRYERLLYHICWAMTGNDADCADIIQEALLRAWQHRDAHPVKNSEQYIVHDLAEAHYDHCDIAVKEAAYDGRSLYVLYSIRDRTVEHPLGEWDDQSGKRLLLDGEEASPGRTADQVGWWTDALWINVQDIGMPNLSSSQRYGSDVPYLLSTLRERST